jgi:hypothetical protein
LEGAAGKKLTTMKESSSAGMHMKSNRSK